MNSKKATHRVNRVVILNYCFSMFHQALQWGLSANAIEYLSKAEVLVELLEVEDCGSIGGFDQTNPVERETNNNAYNRFLALVRKYHDEDNIHPICNFSLNDITYSYQQFSRDFRKAKEA